MTYNSATLGPLITATTALNLAGICDNTLYKHLRRAKVKRYICSWDKRVRFIRVVDLEAALHVAPGTFQKKLQQQ